MPIIAGAVMALALLAATYEPKPLARRKSLRPTWSRIKRWFRGLLG